MTLPLADKRPHTVKNAMELLKRKGVFCYDFVDSIKALSIDHLPPQEAFDNMLTGEKCSNDDYKHASLVWATFDCRTLLDYHNIYLSTDVCLLADVFENSVRCAGNTTSWTPVPTSQAHRCSGIAC